MDTLVKSRNLLMRMRQGGHEISVGSLPAFVVAYWITSSARPSTDCGIVSPSALAVFRLITSSNFVGWMTGISAGLAPFRIRSMKAATRPSSSTKVGP